MERFRRFVKNLGKKSYQISDYAEIELFRNLDKNQNLDQNPKIIKDVWFEILNHLDPISLIQISGVCKQFHKIVKMISDREKLRISEVKRYDLEYLLNNRMYLQLHFFPFIMGNIRYVITKLNDYWIFDQRNQNLIRLLVSRILEEYSVQSGNSNLLYIQYLSLCISGNISQYSREKFGSILESHDMIYDRDTGHLMAIIFRNYDMFWKLEKNINSVHCAAIFRRIFDLLCQRTDPESLDFTKKLILFLKKSPDNPIIPPGIDYRRIAIKHKNNKLYEIIDSIYPTRTF